MKKSVKPTWRNSFQVRLAVVLLAVSGAPAASAREVSSQETASPKVTLGSAYGVPGTIVTIPLMLKEAGTADIAEIVLVHSIPPELSFVRLERAASLQGSNEIEMQSQLQYMETKGEERSLPDKRPVVEVRITRKRNAAALRDGTVGHMAFRINSDADPANKDELRLTHDVKIFVFGGGEAPLPSAAYSEETTVFVEHGNVPVSACFFYMH